MSNNLPKEIFKAYDIRGIVGKTLTAEIVEAVATKSVKTRNFANATRQVKSG